MRTKVPWFYKDATPLDTQVGQAEKWYSKYRDVDFLDHWEHVTRIDIPETFETFLKTVHY